jgi:hypothetical protein
MNAKSKVGSKNIKVEEAKIDYFDTVGREKGKKPMNPSHLKMEDDAEDDSESYEKRLKAEKKAEKKESKRLAKEAKAAKKSIKKMDRQEKLDNKAKKRLANVPDVEGLNSKFPYGYGRGELEEIQKAFSRLLDYGNYYLGDLQGDFQTLIECSMIKRPLFASTTGRPKFKKVLTKEGRKAFRYFYPKSK